MVGEKYHFTAVDENGECFCMDTESECTLSIVLIEEVQNHEEKIYLIYRNYGHLIYLPYKTEQGEKYDSAGYHNPASGVEHAGG